PLACSALCTKPPHRLNERGGSSAGALRAKTFENSLEGGGRRFNLIEVSPPRSHWPIRKASFTNTDEGDEAFTFALKKTMPTGALLSAMEATTSPCCSSALIVTPASLFFVSKPPTNSAKWPTPVPVVGVFDKMRSSHLVATCIMSKQMQLHPARALAAFYKVYLAFIHFSKTFGCCTHILFAQNTRGQIDFDLCIVASLRNVGLLLPVDVKAQDARHQTHTYSL
ncbi:hypothetical protein GN958_ATG00873, partial [Phytophthora infestans]